MKGMVSHWSAIVLLAVGLMLTGCGERGEWMKEEAGGTEGLSVPERRGEVEWDRSDPTQERDGT